MSRDSEDFQYSDSPEPHRARTKKILNKHPEVRKLITRNPVSFILILFIVALQLTIAFLLRDQMWWAALIVAFLVGAFKTSFVSGRLLPRRGSSVQMGSKIIRSFFFG